MRASDADTVTEPRSTERVFQMLSANAAAKAMPSASFASPPHHEAPLPVRAYDIDFSGIVHNVVFVRWLDDLRTGWCDQYLPLTQQIADGYAPVVATTEIAYKRPVRFGDCVVGKLWMQTKRVRWTVEIEIWNSHEMVATARQTGSFLHLATLKPFAVPAPIAAQFPPIREGGSASDHQ